ncbi:MAG: hypothetical protein Q8730_02515 [Sweet potato little leaf phytoplasma]|nr:hypothetical protein [Sweet potato little leaf phytoplasma]
MTKEKHPTAKVAIALENPTTGKFLFFNFFDQPRPLNVFSRKDGYKIDRNRLKLAKNGQFEANATVDGSAIAVARRCRHAGILKLVGKDF